MIYNSVRKSKDIFSIQNNTLTLIKITDIVAYQHSGYSRLLLVRKQETTPPPPSCRPRTTNCLLLLLLIRGKGKEVIYRLEEVSRRLDSPRCSWPRCEGKCSASHWWPSSSKPLPPGAGPPSSAPLRCQPAGQSSSGQ